QPGNSGYGACPWRFFTAAGDSRPMRDAHGIHSVLAFPLHMLIPQARPELSGTGQGENGDTMLVMNKKQMEQMMGRRPLERRAAIVTGSTSGIGLGIARALAEGGAAVMLNGFGDKTEIETLRASLAENNDVDIAYNGADMSKPEAIRAMAAEAQERFGY